MSRNTIARLWIITGVAALALVIASIALTARASDLSNSGYNATLSGIGGPVLVRQGPTGLDPIISILPQGSPVFVVEEIEEGGRRWARIETEALSGWVAAEAVRPVP